MYRVDRRSFNTEAIIEPSTESYQDTAAFGDNKALLEKILDEERPNEIACSRKDGLFIFPELSDAIRFARRMSGSKVHEVIRVEDTVVFHRGDMNLTEVMMQFEGNEAVLKHLARSYWELKQTFKPCWEVLVNKMKVKRIILDAEETNQVARQFVSCGMNIEKLVFYRQHLSER